MTLKKSDIINLPTEWGMFKFMCYTDLKTNKEHLILMYGNFNEVDNCMVRVHSECATGDIFKSLKCDCGPQLDLAMKMVVKEGAGIVVYLKQGEGVLVLKIKLMLINYKSRGLILLKPMKS